MTLHLVRKSPPPDGVVAEADLVLHDVQGAWQRDGTPLDDAELVELVLRAERVVVW